MKKRSENTDARKLMDRLAPDPAFGRLLGIQATTYELQSEFFETDFLPTLLGLGAWDDRNWTSRIALEKHLAELEAATVFVSANPYRGRPRSLRVEIEPVALGPKRALHAKVLLCLYENAIRLIVGSANLTEPGYRRNREAVAVLTASENQATHAALIAGAVREMGQLLQPWSTAGSRLLHDIALERLDSWRAKEANDNQWFVWSGGEQSLLTQFIGHWPADEQIRRLTIVSPFWSEEEDEGPITRLLITLRDLGVLGSGALLRLMTDAAPDKQSTYRPRLPETFARFDASALGIDAQALAVDPRVPPEEVGLGENFMGTRALHAKVVLLEGDNTALAYVGSANFTRHGWGLMPNPRQAHIEAGLIVRRDSRQRETLRSLIPQSVGEPVPLVGAASGRLALPDPSTTAAPWPAFLKEIVLEPGADPDELEMVVTLAGPAKGPWQVTNLPGEDAPTDVLLRVGTDVPEATSFRTPLNQEALNRLLREQEVHVQWWELPEGRSFPINVAASARPALPIGPGTGRPGEQHLIAYYQGRISWEDLFPDPEGPTVPRRTEHEGSEYSGVDTSKIQSYLVREFVEALKGINDDLKRAAQSSRACMRLALLGAVSPVSLAKCAVQAAEAGQRTPTACGFQLGEILACLYAARHFETSNRFRQDWLALIDEATAQVLAMLESVQRHFPHDLTQSFQRYVNEVRQHYLAIENERDTAV